MEMASTIWPRDCPRTPRAADPPLRPQVPHQLLFQHSAGLNEQATVNGFVGHAQASVLGILILQPSGNLLRGPVQKQFTRNQLPQRAVTSQQTGLGPPGRLPGLLIGIVGSIRRSPAMAGDLPAHRRGRTLQTSGDCTERRSASDPAGDILSLGQRECSQRTPTGGRSNPAMTRQQEVNDHMTLVEGPSDLV
jgi:hypothetical protein